MKTLVEIQVLLSILHDIAEQSISQSWGCGDAYLAQRFESSVPYNRFLHAYVQKFKPDAVLECGSYLGTASAHMASACVDTLVLSIDIAPRPELDEVVSHYSNLHYIAGDSTSPLCVETVGKLLGDKRLSLLFLDSAHDGITPQREFMLYSQFFDPAGCLVACDDIIGEAHYTDAMGKFWAWLPGFKMRLDFLHPMAGGIAHHPGFGVSVVCQL